MISWTENIFLQTAKALLAIPCLGCRWLLHVWRITHLGIPLCSPISPGSSCGSLCSYQLFGKKEQYCNKLSTKNYDVSSTASSAVILGPTGGSEGHIKARRLLLQVLNMLDQFPHKMLHEENWISGAAVTCFRRNIPARHWGCIQVRFSRGSWCAHLLNNFITSASKLESFWDRWCFSSREKMRQSIIRLLTEKGS